MEKKIISAKDVAKLANVSQSTVSRVFTTGASVSEKSRKKVLKVAEELNYRPNALARGLIKRKTNIVGLAMKDIQNPFYHEVLGMFTQKLREKGFSVLFVYTENEEIEQGEINNFLEYNVGGIIVTDALLSSNLVTKLHNNNIPVILFNRYHKDIDCHSVSCDNIKAASEIASYIYDKGYRDIVFITGKSNASTSRDRQKGFTDFFKHKGIAITILEGDYSYETSYHLTETIIENGHEPEVVFGANDITAIGALDALKAMSISVPEDVVVIGFDNIKMSSWPSYMLSTWAQPIEEMVNETINLLLTNPKRTNKETLKLKGHFIDRNTTK
ncbi:LacI family DNA-binding transcriptional regulator [Lentibacillus sp. CBA3610]|uniref:LacI family DNA-binding transcriptional regulator n=1 Tax=Lentibacillus sp. CBA3610 TaxID=2518176 RepID=UPI0015959461|nr:LacI family DNA-binding transcriptional regulator [Lentibacillus sp. CBA3610]QKY70043.1 LacI family transcriptional regulator [Lentibacillus sp. CBA3610]